MAYTCVCALVMLRASDYSFATVKAESINTEEAAICVRQLNMCPYLILLSGNSLRKSPVNGSIIAQRAS